MGFKEQFAEDLDEVFFNLAEFAEVHTINGREVVAVVDNDKLEELYISRGTDTERLFTDSIMICVRKSELNFVPVPGQYVDYDGAGYLITDVKAEDGTYTMVLGVTGH